MWLAVHGVPPSAYLRWIRWVGGPRGDIGLEKGPCASFPTCHFFRALVFPVRLLKIHDDFRHLKARCETFLADFWNIFAGRGPRFLGGGSLLRWLRLHLPSRVGVGSAHGCLVSVHHLASNMLRYSLRANWSDASILRL
jgi:hypothetical protein